MELLILGTLAYAGKMLSKSSEKMEFSKMVPNSTTTKKMKTSTRDVENFMQDSVKKHMEGPNTVLSNRHGLVPFFRSEKSQNTNDDVKDRRLATFTGIDMIEYDKKKEVEAPKPVRDYTNINGVTFQPDMERYKYSASLGKHNNTSPVEQTRVGPGLALNPDDEHHDSGYQQYFRILPGNVNGYRKHNYEGSVVHGKSNTDKRTQVAEQQVNKRTSQPDAQYRAFDAPHSSVSGASSKPIQLMSDTHRSLGDMCMNEDILGPKGPNQTYAHVNTTRDNSKVMPTCVYGNPASDGNRIGGYVNTPIRNNDLFTERDTSNCHVLNASNTQQGTYSPLNNADVHTQRENCNNHQLNLTSGGGFINPVRREGMQPKPTQKEQLSDKCNTYIGAVNRANTLGGYSSTDDIRQTGRSIRNTSAGPLLSGPSGAAIPMSSQYQHVYDGSKQCNTRENTNVFNYSSNPQNGINMKTDPSAFKQSMHSRDDNHVNTVVSNPSVTNMNSFKIKDHIGKLAHASKTSPHNNRDFGFAQTQLKENPYAIDINKRYE